MKILKIINSRKNNDFIQIITIMIYKINFENYYKTLFNYKMKTVNLINSFNYKIKN